MFPNLHPLQWLRLLSLTTLTTSTPTPLTNTHGAIASESKLCSRIGIALLASGGNAADAMVGTTLCVGVVSMYHSGLGGGGFMLIRSPHGTYETVDFRETAPGAAYEDMYADWKQGSIRSGLASGVPSELAGLEWLHGKWGVLPWKAVVNPAVHVAREGFRVGEDLVKYMGVASQNSTFLTTDPLWAEDFAPHGKLLGLGDVMTRKRYARMLEIIADKGARAFYTGEIAHAIVETINGNNGSMTLADLEEYTVSIRPALEIEFRGHRIISTPAPSSGSIALTLLKTLEGYEQSKRPSPLTTHRFIESMRFAYAAHTQLGDPAYLPHIPSLEQNIINASTTTYIRSLITDNITHPVDYYLSAHNASNTYVPETAGTSHIVTADASGLSISLTTTVNLLFGSHLLVPHYGIILNNEMNDFSIPHVPNEFGFPPSPQNFIAPLKRPLSSITPIIVENARGRPVLSIGAAGGSRIISATAQAVWGVLEFGMGLDEAIGARRMHDQLMPDYVRLEAGFDEDLEVDLVERGHTVVSGVEALSAVQGVRWLEEGGFEAVSEPRQKDSGGCTI